MYLYTMFFNSVHAALDGSTVHIFWVWTVKQSSAVCSYKEIHIAAANMQFVDNLNVGEWE